MEEDRNLVRIAAFESEHKAVLLRIELNENGIPAWVTGGDGVNTFGAGLTAAGLVGVDVNVHQINAKAAKVVVENFLNRVEKRVPAWDCACGEKVDEGFEVCWSCGNELSEPDDD